MSVVLTEFTSMCDQDLKNIKTYDIQCKEKKGKSILDNHDARKHQGGGILKDSVIKEFNCFLGNWRL